MRRIRFALFPTRTIDGLVWFRFYKEYRSDRRTLRIPFVLQDQYEAGVRRDYQPGDKVGGYGPA